MDARTLFLHAARLHQSGNITQAIALYREAHETDPQLEDCALYLGLALHQLGSLVDARLAYKDAVRLMPSDTEALNGLGAVCLELGNIQEAMHAHMAALKCAPESSDTLGGLGNAFLAQGKTDDALVFFNKALRIAPDSPDTLNNLGVALKTAGRPREAVTTFQKALALNPESAATLCNLGNAWQARGDMQEAKRCFTAAQRIDPLGLAPKWGACFANLDILYESTQQIEEARRAYATDLANLDDGLTLDTREQQHEAASIVGANQPFYLTYQGKNDRDLQARYGALVNRIMTAAYPQFATLHRDERMSKKIRVGIATGFMHEHSVWKIPTRGWVRNLDRTRFEVYGYYTGLKDDHCTAEARELFDKLTHEPNHFEALCQAISDDTLDVLIYPDIGMDPTCAKLAGLRLAPVQCVSLGHPMTTGLPTMDYFLSSELMEPEDGDEAYTEELIRLPNLSVYYDPLRFGETIFDRAHFRLPHDAFLYFCPQSLYKYLPEHDQLFPMIAARVPNCRFIFLENAHADILNKRFAHRLARGFEEYGLDMAAHVIMLPHQKPEAYHALNCLCDVFLDSIQWSGFNTAMEAANAGLPIVTYPKGHMRGRHSRAVATMLDMPEVIANSFDDYVDIAVRMGTDTPFLQTMREKTRQNKSALFGDLKAIRGLEDFLELTAR